MKQENIKHTFVQSVNLSYASKTVAFQWWPFIAMQIT